MNKTKIPFKGIRNYAHGTDLFNAAVAVAGADAEQMELVGLDFMIRKSCLSNEVSIRRRQGEVPVGQFGTFDCRLDGTAVTFDLVEEPPSQIERVAFDESVIEASAECDTQMKSAVLRGEFGFSTAIESIVILNKVMHGRVLPQKVKWLFVRFQCPRILPDRDHRAVWKIQLVEAFGTRLTKSEVYCNDEPVGTIWFSGVVEKK